ncbi:MAG: hypothetical protein AB7E45_07905 [Candidatus Caldatribacteriota bacterium]
MQPQYRLLYLENSIYYALLEYLATQKLGERLITTDNITYTGFTGLPLNFLRPLKVYKNGLEIDTGYVVNYLQNKITFDTPNNPSDVITVDYYYNFVEAITSFPDDINLEITIPSIAIDYDFTVSRPIELGTKRRREYADRYILQLYTSSDTERKVITDMLTQDLLLRSIPYIDFDLGYPLNVDGTKNLNYNPALQTIGYIDFDNITTRSFRGGRYGEVDLYVMEIETTVISYIL